MGYMRPFTTLSPADRLWLAGLLLAIAIVILGNFAPAVFHLSDVWPARAPVSPFGVLVVLDLLFAFHLYERWLRHQGLPVTTGLWAGIVAVVIGFIGSHLFSIAAYFPEQLTDWRALLDLRGAMSSFGGIIVGGLAAWLALRKLGLPVLSGLDAMAYGFFGGYAFGRTGCAYVHDHPGIASDFFLAPVIDGVQRHDLGFYEMLLMLVILAALHAVGARSAAPGTAVATAFLIYAPVRFVMDSLRLLDPRYLGLTPGQWGCLVLFVAGALLLRAARRSE